MRRLIFSWSKFPLSPAVPICGRLSCPLSCSIPSSGRDLSRLDSWPSFIPIRHSAAATCTTVFSDSLQQRSDRARFGPHDQLRDRSESLANGSRICLAGTPLPRCGGYGRLYQSADQCDVQCNFRGTTRLLLPDVDRDGRDQHSAPETVTIVFASASVAGTRTPGPARCLPGSSFRIESSSLV